MNYQKIYNQIIERAKTRQLNEYKETHHITPKCMGGLDIKENLVELTAREHFLCHKLLCEIYPNTVKLKQALWLMVIGKNKHKKVEKYKVGGREYERLKKEYSKTLLGKKRSKKIRKKISQNSKGIKKSKETRLKMSQSRKGHPMYTNEWREKISKGNIGRKCSNIVKKKYSKAKIGKPSNNPTKQILQYDLDGNFIKEWENIKEAKKIYKGVANVLTGISKTSGGYIWKYKI